MRRPILVVLLSIGTLGGFASGLASLHRMHEGRESWERHVAQICVDAARGRREGAKSGLR